MRLFSFLYKKPIFKNRIDYSYKHPEFLVDIEFANRTNRNKRVWVELACQEFEIDYDDTIIFYLQ